MTPAPIVTPDRDPEIQAFVDGLLESSKKTWWQGLYSPVAHLATTVGLGAGAAAFAIGHLGPWSWLTDGAFVVAMACGANIFEWWAHKNVLHKRLPGFFSIMYDEHTRMHHRIYRWHDMAVRARIEWRFTLIPARGVVGVIIAAAGLSALVGLALGPHFGWLSLATFSVYELTYELFHLMLHQSWCPKWINEHHARHHDTTFMQKWNMNVMPPLTDLLFGTFVPKSLLDKRRAALKKSGHTWEED